MKIDPFERHQEIRSPSKIDSGQKAGDIKFGDVLDSTMSTSSEKQTMAVASVAPTAPPVLDVHPGLIKTEVAAASELIEVLEHYQKRLADPLVNLKMLESSIQDMKDTALQAEHLLDDQQAESPLKSIVSEAITSIHLEVERFTSGLYVDE